MGSFTSCNKDLQGPAKIMMEKYGKRAIKYLPKWHKYLRFPQYGSFSHALLNILRRKMAKGFEEKIAKGKLSACAKLNNKWAKQLSCLKLWEAEADCRKRVETARANVKVFVSLTTEEAIDKISNMCPKALVDEITGTRHYTTPFCDYVSDFSDTWPTNGSFESSQIALLSELIDPLHNSGSSDWDYSYMQECFGLWDEIGRKVNYTNGVVRSRPKVNMVSVYKSDDLTVRTAFQMQHQVAATAVAPPHFPVSYVPQQSPPGAVPPSTLDSQSPFGAPIVKILTHTLAPPLYSDLMDQVQSGPIPSPHTHNLNPGATRFGLEYQSQLSPDTVSSPAGELKHASWEGQVKNSSLFAPMIECPNGQGGIQRIYRPWKVNELQAIVGSLPDPKTNGKMFATALKKMVVQCSPTAAELEHVCVMKMGLLWSDVKPATWNSAVDWSIDPQSAYQTQITALATAFETKFKPVINMTIINSCMQKPGESFEDYFVRKLPVFNAHSGNEQPADITTDSPWERQFIQTLVDGLLPDVRKIFVRHCIAWQSARLEDVKKYCLHADTVVKDETNQQLRKSAATHERLQMAQLDFYSTSDGYNDMLCWECHKSGHRAVDCTENFSEESWDNEKSWSHLSASHGTVNN